jgi:hypothetical protein
MKDLVSILTSPRVAVKQQYDVRRIHRPWYVDNSDDADAAEQMFRYLAPEMQDGEACAAKDWRWLTSRLAQKSRRSTR